MPPDEVERGGEVGVGSSRTDRGTEVEEVTGAVGLAEVDDNWEESIEVELSGGVEDRHWSNT